VPLPSNGYPFSLRCSGVSHHVTVLKARHADTYSLVYANCYFFYFTPKNYRRGVLHCGLHRIPKSSGPAL
jgi:hypothetical protein